LLLLASAIPDAARQRFLALVRGDLRGPWPALQRGFLWGASLLYGLVVRSRNLFYDRGWWASERVEVPVVSVGNLTAGGTGKTPCVEYLAGFFRDRDRRVCLLSRGYGSSEGANDEALVLEENLPDVPHLQGPDRVLLARTALDELESEILILDDGFQHRRLHRDLDIVLLDATAPWGHGHLLPRGLLREPPSSLKRAHAVLLTRCDQVAEADLERLRQQARRLAPQAVLAETVHRPVGLVNGSGQTAPLGLVRGAPVAAFCGLGNPEAFRRTVRDLDANLVAFRAYPDHHPYRREDVEELQCWAASLPANAILLTTQKDLVKLRVDQLAARPLWAVRIRLAFREGQAALENLLDRSIPDEPAVHPGVRT
jgi:tetraacyldisaccharide 4'-kinase